MGAFHIDADWDRDGRVTGRAGERAARMIAPGAILLANLDVDRRRLPAAVKDEPRQALDSEGSTAARDDDDAALVEIIAEQPAGAGAFTLSLLVPDTSAATLRVDTASGLGLTPTPSAKASRFLLGTGAPRTALGLHALRLPASPLKSASQATVTLEWRDAAGNVAGSEDGFFTVAPLLLLGDLGPTDRLYMCVDADENDPSVIEVREACAVARVPFIPIPVDVHGGDTWVQDQFQIGYCQAPSATMQVLLHLPRMRSNVVLHQPGANLASFVEGHFPSHNLGVCSDFWQRTLSVTDTTGKSHPLKFQDSATLFYAIARIATVFNLLAFQLLLLSAPLTDPPPSTFSEARRAIPKALAALRAAVAAAKGTAEWSKRGTVLDARVAAMQKLVAGVDTALPLTPAGVGLPLSSQTTAVVDFTEADRVHERLATMHDSLNYGGNIEVGPGDTTSSPGKIVVGEAPSSGTPGDTPRQLDPDLLAFLLGQGVQPLVRIDTSWLDVGHVDELIAFAPDRSSPAGAAIVRASPRVALKILDELRTRHVAGLSGNDLDPFDPYRYSGVFPRETSKGSFPVTHLLRGKTWLHRHRSGDALPLEPPRIYRRLANADQKLLVSAHRIDYQPGEDSDRHYPAHISIFELAEFEDGTNAAIEAGKLAEMDKVLLSEFHKCRVLEVPVLFDHSDDLAAQSTAAFTPDLANLQVVGGHVVIARPYGPRVPLDLAADALAAVLPDDRRGRARRDVLVAKGLDRTVHWVRGPAGEQAVASDFRDGFPGRELPAIAKAIAAANPAHFEPGGRLKAGWRRLLIPEGTVDIFEAYTALVLEPLDAPLHWADSWYYHVALGGLHCATNALRRPPKTTPWWREQRPS